MEPDDSLLIINFIGIVITSILGTVLGLVIAPYFFGG